MTHDVTAADRDAEMLARAAEMDLALAERLHARAMAAEDNADLTELTRAYQRAMRSMRQSLALKARLAEIRARAELARVRAAQAGAEASEAAAARRRKPDYAALRRRRSELSDALGRVIRAFTEREDEAEERDGLHWFLEQRILALDATDDFAGETLDDQVAGFCEEFGIPADLYRGWRDLPPAEPGAPAETPEPADTG